ncbi:MAG: trimeric intracellular cation channel family protein [Rhodobiaceae bacterium]|nr:trimeric intracellular cation channel family protein [Rhodobiaceae bacterium]MCC0018179.1 trimeric intracellular cation channel family protein [Rhodobiaceae bacterium]MCC0051255.1 trimeric intracellular cation channel family protein [Rhodobiaceae bacterium]MCC0053084.1 trimeric intracellular cation channel family protein [Rhodobiaceae bacterium]
MTPIEVLDYVGVALFAATGALAASRNQLDIIGFLFLAAVTGIGGGTVRDLVLDVPVFWVEQPVHVLVCTLTAIFVYFTAHLIESRYRLLLWLDAIALAAYGVFGAYKGLAATDSVTVAIVMGMMTGTLGGIIRDVLAREPSVLLRQEIYVAAAISGAAGFVALSRFGLPTSFAAGLGFMVALFVRGGAIQFQWKLPAYKSRPGRHPDELH